MTKRHMLNWYEFHFILVFFLYSRIESNGTDAMRDAMKYEKNEAKTRFTSDSDFFSVSPFFGVLALSFLSSFVGLLFSFLSPTCLSSFCVSSHIK